MEVWCDLYDDNSIIHHNSPCINRSKQSLIRRWRLLVVNGEPNWKRGRDVRTTGFGGHCAGIFSQNLSILRQMPPKTATPSSFQSFIELSAFFFFAKNCFSLARQAICLKWMWLFDAGVSFCRFFFFFSPCSTAHLDLVIFGTLMKRDGDKTWLFPVWRHCLCHWASRVFYLHSAKNGCVKFCCADFYRIGRTLFFSRCLAQGRRDSTICTLLATFFYLISMKEYWCGSHWAFSHSRGVITCSKSVSLTPADFEVWH